MNNQIHQLLGLFLLCLASLAAQAQGTDCSNPQLFCDNTIDPFPAGVNQPNAPMGNNYDCLFTQPNPAWYYMNISQGGNLDFFLANTNNVDIDFIVWGPFPDLSTAVNNCGNLQNVAACSYSTGSTEQVTLNNVQAGEVYLLLITNFSNQPTDIFTTPGNSTAQTSCDCGINANYSLPALAQNSGVLLDTMGYAAEFAVCSEDTLIFQIDLGSIGDSLSIFNSSLFSVFPAPTASLFGPFYVNNFDSVQYLVQLDASGLAPGNYDFDFDVLASGVNNCVQTLPIRVVVPGVQLSAPDLEVCSVTGDTLQLEVTSFGTGGGSYSWQQIGGPPLPLSNTNVENPNLIVPPNVAEGTTYNYVATYTDSLGCSGSDTLSVTVLNTVTLNTATPDQTVCAGDTLRIVVDGSSSLPSTSGCGLNTASSCLSPANTVQVGQGTAVVTTNSPYNGFWEDSRTQLLFRANELQAQGLSPGLIRSLSFFVDAFQLPTTLDYNDFTIKIGCVVDSVLLSDSLISGLETVYSSSITAAQGWNSYSFQSNYEWDGVSNLVVEICFDNADWEDNLSVLATATSFPSVAQAEQDGAVGCNISDNFTLTSSLRPNVRFENCTIPPLLTVTSTPMGLNSSNPLLLLPDTTGTYVLNISDGFCAVNDTLSITVEEGLPAPEVLCGTATTSSIRFDWNSLVGATGYEYSTDGGQTWILTTATGVEFTGLAQGATRSLIVRAIDANNTSCPIGLASAALTCTTASCDLEASVYILNNPCDALNAGEVQIRSNAANASLNYDWGAGAQTDSLFSNLSAGDYTVTVTDTSTACTDTVQFRINEGIELEAWVENIGQRSAELNDLPATLDIGAILQSNGNLRYRWTSSLVADSLAQNTTVFIEESQNYFFEIIALTEDCELRDTVFVEALETGFTGIPNIFTPNGDEVNDRFAPVGLVGAQVTRFEIYNRWGLKVYDNPSYDDGGWNGSINGEPQPRDVYIYILEYQFPRAAEPELIRGEVTLLR